MNHQATLQFPRRYTGMIFRAFVLVFLAFNLTAQEYFEGFHSHYDADIVEWDIYTDQNEGKLEMTWVQKRDITDWYYELGDYSGTIRQKWQNSFDEYELRSDEGNVITMKVKWRNDFSQWVITSNTAQFLWRTTYQDDGNRWQIDDEETGEFFVFTEFEGDPRDYLIEDHTHLDFIEEKVACLFITMIRSVLGSN